MEDDEARNPSLPTLNFPFLPPPPPTVHSPDHHSGMTTPPLHTLASVPFKWEELPGKPRPCTDIIALPEPPKISLELPPNRLTNKIMTKMPSPTTVLEGPYNNNNNNAGRPKFSSFRFFREAHASFDSSSGSDSPRSAADVLLRKKNRRWKRKGFFGRTLRFFKYGKKEVDDEGSFGFSPFSTTVKMESKITSKESFSSFSHAKSTHFWGAIYGSLKQALPWKTSTKSNQDRHI